MRAVRHRTLGVGHLRVEDEPDQGGGVGPLGTKVVGRRRPPRPGRSPGESSSRQATASAKVVLPAPGVAVSRKSRPPDSSYVASASFCQARRRRGSTPIGTKATTCSPTRREDSNHCRTRAVTNHDCPARTRLPATADTDRQERAVERQVSQLRRGAECLLTQRGQMQACSCGDQCQPLGRGAHPGAPSRPHQATGRAPIRPRRRARADADHRATARHRIRSAATRRTSGRGYGGDRAPGPARAPPGLLPGRQHDRAVAPLRHRPDTGRSAGARSGPAPLAQGRGPHPVEGVERLTVRDELAGRLLVGAVHRPAAAGPAGVGRLRVELVRAGHHQQGAEPGRHLPARHLQPGGRHRPGRQHGRHHPAATARPTSSRWAS